MFIDAGESAKTAARPEFQRLLAFCRENKGRVQFVVAYNVSRFAHQAHDHLAVAAHLRKLGVTLRSATEPTDDSSTGKLMEHILASFAQFDNDLRAERTVTGMKAALGAGKWTFQAPLGYRRTADAARGTTIEPDPERAPLVRRAFELFASGLQTKSEVLRAVSGLGLRTRTGRPVSPETFRTMLSNPMYAGWLTVRKWNDLAPQRGDFEAIVNDDLFERVQRLLAGKAQAATPHARNNPDFPLRVFVKCGECGASLTGSLSKGRSAHYPYYRCPTSACETGSIRKVELENDFLRYLDALAPKPEYVRLFREVVLDVWNQKQADVTTARQTLQRNLDALLAKKDRVVDAFLHRGVLDQRTYQRQCEKLDEEILLTESAFYEARLDELDVEGLLTFAEYVLTRTGRLWAEASLDQKQRLQKLLFPSGVTYSRNAGFGTAETCVIFRLLQVLPGGNSEVVTLTSSSWNQLFEWLADVASLQRSAAAGMTTPNPGSLP